MFKNGDHDGCNDDDSNGFCPQAGRGWTSDRRSGRTAPLCECGTAFLARVNYRTGGLDITASFWAGRYGHSKLLQKDDMYYLCGQDVYEGYTNQETKNVWKGWSPQLQINYMVDNNHSHLQGKESQP